MLCKFGSLLMCQTLVNFSPSLSAGFQSSASREELSPHLDVLDLPWHDELCCDSPVAHLLPDHPHCSFKSRTPDHSKASGGKS